MSGKRTKTCPSCGDEVEGEPCTVPGRMDGHCERGSGVMFACDCGREWIVTRGRERLITPGNGDAVDDLEGLD